MAQRIVAATHKGLFTFVREGEAWREQEQAFLGDSVTMFLEDDRDGSWYAALDLGHFGVKLHRREPGGEWVEVGVPVYPEADDSDKETAASLKEIWCLEPGDVTQEGRLWAGTIPGGLFVSDDCGDTWQLVESLWGRPERLEWFGGGKDEAGIHSICRDPRDSNRLLVGVSCGGVWVTGDGGESWEVQADGMHAEYMPPERHADPIIQDVHRLVQWEGSPESLWIQHHNAIYRSRDGAASWQSITSADLPSVFGFAVVVHPQDPETAWFVPAIKDECRVPLEGRFVVARTRDGGESFELFDSGLPAAPAYDIVFRHGLVIDETGEVLVLGSSTGGLWASEDAGESWQVVSANLPQVYCVAWVQ